MINETPGIPRPALNKVQSTVFLKQGAAIPLESWISCQPRNSGWSLNLAKQTLIQPQHNLERLPRGQVSSQPRPSWKRSTDHSRQTKQGRRAREWIFTGLPRVTLSCA